MRRFLLCFALYFAGLAFTQQSVLAAPTPLGKLDGTVMPTAYRLDLTVQPEQPRFRGHVEIDVEAKGGETGLFLHGRELHVTKAVVTQGGKPFAARYRELEASTIGVAQLEWGQALAAGPATLTFDYDAAFATGGAGLFHLKVGDNWYVWSQLEAIDARAVFPCFDEPGFKTPFSVRVVAPAGQLAVSNAAQTSEEPVGKLVRHTFAPTAPLPTYLLAVAVGPFDVVESTVPPSPQRKEPLPLRVIATRGQREKLAYALAETKPIVALLESYFNRPFPFPKLDQIATPLLGGAMENAGAVIYNDTLLVLDESSPVPQKQAFGMVVAHELAHQWFGDLVTPAWWEDIWLNESFANWLGYRTANLWKPELNIGSGAVNDGFNAMELDALHEGRPIQQPINKNGEIESAFDRITYGKGGKVIEMVESYLGAERFQKGVQLHMQRFAGRNASSDDFFRSLSDAAGEARLVKSMHDFITQQGVPVVEVEVKGKQLLWKQKRYAPYNAAPNAPTLWSIPFCARVARGDKHCALLDAASGAFEWPVLAQANHGALLPNAGGHGYYRFSMSDPLWRELIAVAPKLTPGEALAALDSLWAEWRAGALSLPLLIEATRAFATHADSYVAIEAGERLSALRMRSMLTPEQLPAYQRLFSQLYAARLQKLGTDLKKGAYASDPPDTQRLRARLVHFLVNEAEPGPLGDALVAAASKWLDGDEAALDLAFLTDALHVWLGRNGAEGVKRVWKKVLATHDVDLRQRMLYAIPDANDPAVARAALDNVNKSSLTPIEKLLVTVRVTRTPRTRELGFGWLNTNFDKLVKETNLTTVSAIFTAASGFCTAADADRIEKAMRPRVQKLGRGALPLARVVEDVRNCASLQSARAAELRAAFPERAQELDTTRR